MAGVSRRDVLGSAALAGAVVTAGTQPVRQTERRRDPVTTFVFIAGSSEGGSGDAELTMRGHRTVAVEFPGHEPTASQFRRSYQAPQDLAALATERSPMAGVTLNDYVERTVEVVRRVARHGPVMVCGASMGGATLSRVGNEIPDLIDRLVYISAFCCVNLPTCTEYLTTPEAAGSMLFRLGGVSIGDPAVIGGSRSNWRTADPTMLSLLKEALLAEGTDAEFFTMLNGLHPDESTEVPLADARGHRDTWGRVPRTFIRLTKDRCLPLALQDRMIAEADALTPRNPFDVRSVDTSHVPDKAGWRAVIDILDGLATRHE